MKTGELHEPVLLTEVIDLLHIKKGFKYIDSTVGTGGHTLQIVSGGGDLLGIDADAEMLAIAADRLIKAAGETKDKDKWGSYKLVEGNFRNITRIADDNGWTKVSGILADLGVSNLQLTSSTRGFSFNGGPAPLDMRIDRTGNMVTAKDILNGLRRDQLEELFREVLEYKDAKKVAANVLRERNIKPIETTADFMKALAGYSGKDHLNRGTLPFLALRIAVNSEIENLKIFLQDAFELLERDGVLAVITFHSLEDAVVKDFFNKRKEEETATIPLKKPVVPSESEIEKNKKSRSAKLRVLIKK